MAAFDRFLWIGILLGSALSAHASDTVNLAPIEDRPLSPNIETIPDFEPIWISRPYKSAWQIALLLHQRRYVAQVGLAVTDPIETGGISQ